MRFSLRVFQIAGADMVNAVPMNAEAHQPRYYSTFVHALLVSQLGVWLVFLDMEHPDLFVPSVLVGLAGGVAVFIAAWCGRKLGCNPHKLSVTLTLGLLFFFCGSPVVDMIAKFLLQSPLAGHVRSRHVLGAAAGLVLGCIWTGRTAAPALSKYLNLTIPLVLVATACQMAWRVWSREHVIARSVGTNPASANPNALRPDIYNIVLDAFTSYRQLQKHWGYTNSPLVQFLRDRNFLVNESAHSNFPATVDSLGISLNMAYPLPAGEMSPMRRILISRGLLRRAAAVRMIQSQGYEMSNFSFLDLGLGRALVAEPEFMVPSWKHLLRWSPVNFEIEPVGSALTAIERDRVVINSFESMLARPSAKDAAPRFCFIHLLLPRGGYRYDREGHPLAAKPANSHDGYFEQLLYTEKIASNLVSRILANSPRPPVIILQGDHGSRTVLSSRDGYPWDPDESTSILCGLLLPDGGDKLAYPDMTPVNFYRLIARHYFKIPMPFLEDLSCVVGSGKEWVPVREYFSDRR